MQRNLLRDLRRQNRHLLVQTLMEKGSLSRTELTALTGLAAGTVSTLVAELLAEGIFVEAGTDDSTGGRRRVRLECGADFGVIAVADVRRGGAALHLFDMGLRKRETLPLADRLLDGDELFTLLVSALTLSAQEGRAVNLKAIGLLFQEDMRSADFSVMYSTSLSSETISLKDALESCFHVPVTEEYSTAYSISTVLAAERKSAAEDAAYVAIGQNVLASVRVGGAALRAGEKTQVFDLTPLAREDGEGFAALTGGEAKLTGALAAAARALSRALKPLCVFFPVKTVFLEGPAAEFSLFLAEAEKLLRAELVPLGAAAARGAPRVEAAPRPEAAAREAPVRGLAELMRTQFLCAA